MNKSLEKARAFEKEKIREYDPAKRPAFHLTGLAGWINDPNGFSFFGSCAHLFYQANLFDRQPGQICWGHAVTKDFVHWTYLRWRHRRNMTGTAVSPDRHSHWRTDVIC